MFVLQRDVTAAKKVIATLLATAMVLWAFGVQSFAEAANITDVSITLTDSSPNGDSDHTIDFITPTGIGTGETVVITYPSGFDLSVIDAADVEIHVDGSNDDADWTPTINSGAGTITLTQDSNTVAEDGQITVYVGFNAASGDAQIGNPTDPDEGNESYEISIAGTMTDSGYTRVVILSTVLVTAQVRSTFDFTVTGLDAGVAVNGETTTGTSSSTTIPFGVLTAGTPEVQAQDLQVQTNARNGFVVTVQSDGQFRSSTGADIDRFTDDTDVTSPTTWVQPTNTVLDENTWGHWGVTTEDQDTGISGDDGLGNGDEFGANDFIGVSTTPRAIFAHDGPADNFTANVGSTTVGYKVEITALQEAADDYQTTLTYIATPTF